MLGIPTERFRISGASKHKLSVSSSRGVGREAGSLANLGYLALFNATRVAPLQQLEFGNLRVFFKIFKTICIWDSLLELKMLRHFAFSLSAPCVRVVQCVCISVPLNDITSNKTYSDSSRYT